MKKAPAKSRFQLVLSTVNSEEQALSLAKALVEQKIIACANIIAGVKSIYHWQGKVHNDSEFLLIMKTAAPFAKVEAAILKHHPYEVPEIVSVTPAAVGKLYGEWLAEVTLGKK